MPIVYNFQGPKVEYVVNQKTPFRLDVNWETNNVKFIGNWIGPLLREEVGRPISYELIVRGFYRILVTLPLLWG